MDDDSAHFQAKEFEGIPSEWHETVKVMNPETQRVKLYFRCKYEGCGQQFSKSCNLRDHFRKHTKMRPFNCHLCGKTFTQSGNLGRHLRNVHKQERIVPRITRASNENDIFKIHRVQDCQRFKLLYIKKQSFLAGR